MSVQISSLAHLSIDSTASLLCVLATLTSWLPFHHAQFRSDGELRQCKQEISYSKHYAKNLLTDWCQSYQEVVKCMDEVLKEPLTHERIGNWYASLMFDPELTITRSKKLCAEMKTKVDEYYCENPGSDFAVCVRYKSQDLDLSNVTIGQREDIVRERLCTLIRGQRDCFISHYGRNCAPETRKVVAAVQTMTESKCFEEDFAGINVAQQKQVGSALLVLLLTISVFLQS